MKRRDIVKRIGAAGLLVGVSAGAASAQSGGRTPPEDLTAEELADRDDVTADDNYCIVDDCNLCPPACEYCIC